MAKATNGDVATLFLALIVIFIVIFWPIVVAGIVIFVGYKIYQHYSKPKLDYYQSNSYQKSYTRKKTRRKKSYQEKVDEINARYDKKIRDIEERYKKRQKAWEEKQQKFWERYQEYERKYQYDFEDSFFDDEDRYYEDYSYDDSQNFDESKDYHEILGVTKDATPKEIKTRYRKLILKFHPDRNHESDAPKKCQEIIDAYEHLIYSMGARK